MVIDGFVQRAGACGGRGVCTYLYSNEAPKSPLLLFIPNLLQLLEPKMRTIHSLVALLVSAGIAIADFGIHIPQVDAAVQQLLSKFGAHVSYHGPSGDAAAQAQGFRPKQAPPPAANTGAYWMEQIQHQGVAAFNPNAGYQVFRNVKVPSPLLPALSHNLGQVADSASSRTLVPREMVSLTTLLRSTMPSAAVVDALPVPANPQPLHLL